MMTTQRVVTLLLEGDIYAAPAMNPECEAPSCDDDVPVKLKMSVTLSCAGLVARLARLTGLTVGKHGYRWRLLAAAHREHILQPAPTVAWVARRRQERRKW